jgi:3-hydroxybutyrate dehydrogenase
MTDTEFLKDKNVIVTGSTSGIGLGIAKMFAKEGANVIINGLADQFFIANLCNDIVDKSVGNKVIYHSADMSKESEIIELVKFAHDNLGAIDILVNNAGVQYVAPIEEFPSEQWEKIIAINLSSTFHLVRNFLAGMKIKNWGRIINIASTHGLVASANKSAYVAAKHGLVGLSKVIALEVAAHNITCNAICPGWVRTDLVEKQIASIAQEKNISINEATNVLLCEKQPSGRFIEVDDIAQFVLFLCSKTADNITGAALTVDGAWTAV